MRRLVGPCVMCRCCIKALETPSRLWRARSSCFRRLRAFVCSCVRRPHLFSARRTRGCSSLEVSCTPSSPQVIGISRGFPAESLSLLYPKCPTLTYGVSPISPSPKKVPPPHPWNPLLMPMTWGKMGCFCRRRFNDVAKDKAAGRVC